MDGHVLPRRRHHGHLLQAELPRADAQARERPLLPDRRGGGGRRLPRLQALQARVILPVAEPYDWARVLDWLGTRAIPGLEEVGDGAYRRGGVTVTYRGGGELHVEGEADPAVVARVFDAAPRSGGAPRRPGLRGRARDPGPRRVERVGARGAGGARPAGQRRRRAADRGEARRRAAATLPGAGGGRRGGRCPACPPPGTGRCAHSRARSSDGLRLDPPLDLAATRAALLALPGFGPWTVEYIAMRALRDPDAWPASDLWLRRATDAGADPDALAAVPRLRGDGDLAAGSTRLSAARTIPRPPGRGRRRGRARRR